MGKPNRWAMVAWLHRHGVARTVQHSTSTSHPDVRYLMEARWWTPHWLLLWAARQRFQQDYSSRASTMYLATVQPRPVAVDGTQHWVLHWQLSR